MKIYLIEMKEYEYDEYDGFVVIAENKERAWEIIVNEHSPKPEYYGNMNIVKDNIKRIEEIGTTELEEQIVLGSYNAG